MESFDQIIRNEGLQICMGSPSASLGMAEQPHDNEQQHTDLVTGGAPLPLTSDDPGRSAAHIAARPVVRQGPGGAPMVNISHNLRKCTLLEEAPLQDKQQVRRRNSTKMRCDDNPQENVEEIFFAVPAQAIVKGDAFFWRVQRHARHMCASHLTRLKHLLRNHMSNEGSTDAQLLTSCILAERQNCVVVAGGEVEPRHSAFLRELDGDRGCRRCRSQAEASCIYSAHCV